MWNFCEEREEEWKKLDILMRKFLPKGEKRKNFYARRTGVCNKQGAVGYG